MVTTAVHNTITSLDKLLPHVANKIRSNLEVNTDLVLFVWQLTLVNGTIQKIWMGKAWVLFSEKPYKPGARYFHGTGIRTNHGEYGLRDIPSPVWKEIHHPNDLPLNKTNKWAYRGRAIYPEMFQIKLFLNDLPGIRTENLLNGKDPEQFHEAVFPGEHCD
jgi:hypothetical protein